MKSMGGSLPAAVMHDQRVTECHQMTWVLRRHAVHDPEQTFGLRRNECPMSEMERSLLDIPFDSRRHRQTPLSPATPGRLQRSEIQPAENLPIRFWSRNSTCRRPHGPAASFPSIYPIRRELVWSSKGSGSFFVVSFFHFSSISSLTACSRNSGAAQARTSKLFLM
jgi:hypothetical protein